MHQTTGDFRYILGLLGLELRKPPQAKSWSYLCTAEFVNPDCLSLCMVALYGFPNLSALQAVGCCKDHRDE